MSTAIISTSVNPAVHYCKESYKPSGEVLKFWGLEKAQGVDFVRSKGCFHCKDTGYKGRTGLYEVLQIDDDVREMILTGRSAQEITRTFALSGQLTTLKMDAAQKVANGITTVEEAASAVMM